MTIARPDWIGSSPALASVRRAVEQVAGTDATVLITGETGTGKEIVARFLHTGSRRARGPFAATNCGAVVPTLVTSELFGHEIGAFTGATRRRVGKFEQAHRGTLFLDEVGELPPDVQPLLLRALQEQIVEPLGGDPIPVDVRIVAATNRVLETDVQTGRFRADLFYRLNVFPIHVPPLRDRRDDIVELALAFLRRFAAAHGRAVHRIPARVVERLAMHDWPGNVRELQNVIERAVIVSTGADLEFEAAWLATPVQTEQTKQYEPIASGRTWAEQEKSRILDALLATGGRIYGPGGAAHRLGLRPTTLYGKMRKHGIARDPASWQ